MRPVSDQMYQTWDSGDFTGAHRPIVRATIQRGGVLEVPTADNVFGTVLFNNPNVPVEMPNVKSCEWQRSLQQDTATLTLTLYNTALVEGVDVSGWYSPSTVVDLSFTDTEVQAYRRKLAGLRQSLAAQVALRNQAIEQAGGSPTDVQLERIAVYNKQIEIITRAIQRSKPPRLFTKITNTVQNMLVPDNIIRTYQGYGADWGKCAERDPNLMQTGIWLIDQVSISSTSGEIVVTARDVSRLLLDSILFLPIVPKQYYPVQFVPIHLEPSYIQHAAQVIPINPQRIGLSYSHDSNVPWDGYNGSEFGHRPTEAFDDNPGTYWMSVGNSVGNSWYTFEHIEGACANTTVQSVQFDTPLGGETYYIGIFANGAWQGGAKVPYDGGHNPAKQNGSDQLYVVSGPVVAGTNVVNLPRFDNVTKVRVTFGNLRSFGPGPYTHRAVVSSLRAYGADTNTIPAWTETQQHHHGNFNDYTDIVKMLCAWGGFYWPADAYVVWSDGTKHSVNYTGHDSSFNVFSAGGVTDAVVSDDVWNTIMNGGGPNDGRVWGEFLAAGVASQTQLTPDMWDKKTVMDGVRVIQDLLGFTFWISEDGFVVWRSPNQFNLGNWITGYGTRTDNTFTIDGKRHIIDLTANLTSANVRDTNFIGTVDGQFGAVSHSLLPGPSRRNLRRVAGWTDQHFANQVECQRMADMISVQQLFSYRTDQVTIAGFPGVQLDDQIKIVDEVSGEYFLHYVQGIHSTLSMEDGTWLYQMDTNWLGSAPFTDWAFDSTLLAPETQQFLDALGAATPYGAPVIALPDGASPGTAIGIPVPNPILGTGGD